MQSADLIFPPFRLDIANEELWQGAHLIPLRPKPFAILRYLVAHAGRLVTKDELTKAIWADTYVGESSLKGYIRVLRAALQDDPHSPQFIEAIPRRGYRFLGAVQPQPSAAWNGSPELNAHPSPLPSLPVLCIGRQQELAQLHAWLRYALAGQRQMIFITGEPGIGKTTVIEALLTYAASLDGVKIARGQCIEHYGTSEGYLPFLDALGRLGRETGGTQVLEILRRYAPTWLVQMPGFIADAELELLQWKIQVATRERMLREMAEAMDALTAKTPLIFVLEDLQWSDYATLDLLAALARRQAPARLLVIGTYRPADVVVSGHPLKTLKQELQLHRQCVELPMGGLSEEDIGQYLTVRFPQNHFPANLASAIHRSTEGNPLFMVTVVDEVLVRGVVRAVTGQWELTSGVEDVETSVPESVRQLIERQIERLTKEHQRVLEAASVVGADFSAVLVAAALGEELELIEEQCEELARRGQFIQSRGIATFPDGTTAGRYRFLHTLYQQTLYDRVAAVRRMRLHRRIAAGEEVAYGNHSGEIAASLALHFERGQDYAQAVRYLGMAAANAIHRSAYREAITATTKQLTLLTSLPDTPARVQHELAGQTTLGVALMNTLGFAAPAVEQAYARARVLCQEVGETPQLFPTLWGLRSYYNVRAEFTTARELAEQLFSLAEHAQNPELLLEGHLGLGMVLFYLGEVVAARTHLEETVRRYDPRQHRAHASLYGQDPGVLGYCHLSSVSWGLGYPDQAAASSCAAVTLAQELSHPFSLAYAHCFAAAVRQGRGEVPAVTHEAEAALRVSRSHGFPHFLAMSTLLHGWAIAKQNAVADGIGQLCQGLDAQRNLGIEIGRTYYLALLAEVHEQEGQIAEGLKAVNEALLMVQQKGEAYYVAELYRRKGELLLKAKVRRRMPRNWQSKARVIKKRSPMKRDGEAEAEACFQQAIDVARRQSAKSLELRAVMSLSRLWQHQGKKEEARKLLAEMYHWFTEGFDTKDLQEAKTLLAELS